MTTGQTSFPISIDIKEDLLLEMDETFTASLSILFPTSPLSDRITIAPVSTTVTISDNDGECTI